MSTVDVDISEENKKGVSHPEHMVLRQELRRLLHRLGLCAC